MNTAGTARSTEGLQTGEFITGGDLSIHVRVKTQITIYPHLVKTISIKTAQQIEDQ
jgi:hypothetical protein